jgi:type I restriction enzyme M protein
MAGSKFANLGFEEKLFKAADKLRKNFVLTPGGYCGSAAIEDDGEPFAEKFARLRSQFAEQFEGSARLQGEIERNLASLGDQRA